MVWCLIKVLPVLVTLFTLAGRAHLKLPVNKYLTGEKAWSLMCRVFSFGCGAGKESWNVMRLDLRFLAHCQQTSAFRCIRRLEIRNFGRFLALTDSTRYVCKTTVLLPRSISGCKRKACYCHDRLCILRFRNLRCISGCNIT